MPFDAWVVINTDSSDHWQRECITAPSGRFETATWSGWRQDNVCLVAQFALVWGFCVSTLLLEDLPPANGRDPSTRLRVPTNGLVHIRLCEFGVTAAEQPRLSRRHDCWNPYLWFHIPVTHVESLITTRLLLGDPDQGTEKADEDGGRRSNDILETL